jgi:ribosomal protein L16 Arg81 hydroxylase
MKAAPVPNEVAVGSRAFAPSGFTRRILAPLGTEEFVSAYWGKKALYLPGAPSKFEFLFDEQRFDRAIRCAHAKQQVGAFRLRALERDVATGLTLGKEIAPDDVDRAMAAGLTICVNDIGAGDDELAYLAHDFRTDIGHAGRTHFNCYRSLHGFGSTLHFDGRVGCTLQIAGKKRWRYSRTAAVEWPRANAQHREGSPSYIGLGGLESWEQLRPVQDSELEEVVLNAGDLLCLPAGTWHETCAEGDSLALNLSSGPVGFAEIVKLALETALLCKPEWRSVTPTGRLGSNEEWPAEALDYCRERLREASAFLAALERDPRRLLQAWSTVGRI